MSQQGGRFGYGRVSTRDQHTESQHDALTAAGVEPDRLFIEKVSTRLASRPQLEEVRKYLRRGDVLVVTKVDRLARSLLDLITIANDLKERGVTLEVLSGHFNRDDPMGEAFFQMTGVFAQLERDMIRMRTLEGLKAAKARGRVGGRKYKLNDMQKKRLYEMADATIPVAGDDPGPGEQPRTKQKYAGAEIAEELGISRSVVYDYLRRRQAEQAAATAGEPKREVRVSPDPWEPHLDEAKVTELHEMHDAKVPVAEIARKVGVSRQTVYNYVRDRKQANGEQREEAAK